MLTPSSFPAAISMSVALLQMRRTLPKQTTWLDGTAVLGRAVYYSRSRGKLWFKGEESGHVQRVHDIRLDCDNDVVLLKVTQLGHDPGIACHTGRHSCFFQQHQQGAWVTVDPVLKNPEHIYTSSAASAPT